MVSKGSIVITSRDITSPSVAIARAYLRPGIEEARLGFLTRC
jgi:hypothetical protein